MDKFPLEKAFLYSDIFSHLSAILNLCRLLKEKELIEVLHPVIEMVVKREQETIKRNSDEISKLIIEVQDEINEG